MPRKMTVCDIDLLEKLVGKQKTQEAYLSGKREYKPRVRD